MSRDRETGSWRHAETHETLDAVDTLLNMRVPALTILYHPRPSRVGEQCRLVPLSLGNGASISRLEPIFSPVGVTRGEPLADARLSRRPVWLEKVGTEGDIRIEATRTSSLVVVDGQTVEDSMLISAHRLERGVVIELARRFVLLLHTLGRPPSRQSDLGLVGDNEKMVALREDIVRVGDLNVPVLLRGESGTGKELVAKAIHAASPRKGPCVAVNMAAIQPSTAASELFGHVRGAFTGAARDHDGFFLRANGGTLFMDEVGETPSDLQVMLLRTLETQEIQAVGASRSRRVDVRLVAATDGDLERMTEDGGFRLPLLHRLAGYEIRITPLRERRDDIARLFFHFIREELDSVGELDRLSDDRAATPWIPAGLLSRLVRYHWPGNVRQLRNVARQLVISSRGHDAVRIDPAMERLLKAAASAPRTAGPAVDAPTPPPAAARPVSRPRKKPSEITEDELAEVLRENEWKMGPTAKILGMSRTTLYAMVEQSTRIRKARDLTADEIEAALSGVDDDVGAAAASLEVSKRGLQLRMKELEPT